MLDTRLLSSSKIVDRPHAAVHGDGRIQLCHVLDEPCLLRKQE